MLSSGRQLCARDGDLVIEWGKVCTLASANLDSLHAMFQNQTSNKIECARYDKVCCHDVEMGMHIAQEARKEIKDHITMGFCPTKSDMESGKPRHIARKGIVEVEKKRRIQRNVHPRRRVL